MILSGDGKTSGTSNPLAHITFYKAFTECPCISVSVFYHNSTIKRTCQFSATKSDMYVFTFQNNNTSTSADINFHWIAIGKI